MKAFLGEVVIITGGATGIGKVTAQQFLKEGSTVIIACLPSDPYHEIVRWAEELGKQVVILPTDVTKEEQVQSLIAQSVDLFGKIDVLVNNAAIFESNSLLEESTEKWRRVFDVILQGSYLTTKHVGRVMRDQRHGCIVNVSSINSSRALNMSSHYNAAKGALDQLTRCSALELSPYGVRINGVAPGFIETPMSIVDGENEHETEEFIDYYVGKRKLPLGRPGIPKEVADTILFLASEHASYIQGAIIPVDGGLSITF
jgi:meso-butanediol dehydrogenase / (S,S)-butanediol dehydrogenase / diacetyl reductase